MNLNKVLASKIKKYKIGMRTIKTALAVSIGLFVAETFNLQSPLFVGIGAIHTMQASVSESFKMGKNRMLGTVMGAIVAVVIATYLPRNEIFMGLGIIIVIHMLNLLNWKKSISLSAIVFIAVFLNHEYEMVPYAVSRVLDTFVGIVIGVIVNYFIAAPNSDKLFGNFVRIMTADARKYAYQLTVGKHRVDLTDFKDELAAIEKVQNLIKDETKINILRPKGTIESEIIMKVLYEIYYDLSALQMMQYIATISPDNLDLIEELYSIRPIWEMRAIIAEKDIIFNYHLQRLLKNLILLENQSKNLDE